MDAGNRVVGIDLGTTYSAVAVFDGDGARPLPNALGDLLTPSVVAWDARTERVVVGRTAKDIWALRPDYGAGLFKRAMGTEESFAVGPQRLSAVECSALVLRQLREDAEAELGRAVTRAVITVPAYFNEDQRRATREAGTLAGLGVERILNEPTAAAIAYGLHQGSGAATFLVFDLGGGTFDVCVMERFEGVLQVRSVAGESRLGGEDFTRALVGRALMEAGTSFELAELRDPAGTAQLIARAERAKRELSRGGAEASLPLRVPALQSLFAEPRDVVLDAGQIEAAFEPWLQGLVGPIRSALRHAELNRELLDEILLVGGATRLPAVVRFVERHFARTPRAEIDPDLAVVRGAAVQAALHDDVADVGDLVVTDVASHTLGVETSRQLGTTRRNGYFAPILHRNTVIPTSRVERFWTIDPGQTEILLRVYEGESRHVENNREIGQVWVKGIPKTQGTEGVDVRFTYDLDGILEVEATVVSTGKVVRRVFERSGRELGEAEARAASERLAGLKRDARDLPAVRDTLARAELLVQEVEPQMRERLEWALHALDEALEARDPAAIHEMTEQLRQLCEDLDRGDRW
ncbi:MAG: Hsp70 family protein [Planctomycetota bacterium]